MHLERHDVLGRHTHPAPARRDADPDDPKALWVDRARDARRGEAGDAVFAGPATEHESDGRAVGHRIHASDLTRAVRQFRFTAPAWSHAP